MKTRIRILIEASFDPVLGALSNISFTAGSPGRGKGVPLKSGFMETYKEPTLALIRATFDLERAYDEYEPKRKGRK